MNYLYFLMFLLVLSCESSSFSQKNYRTCNNAIPSCKTFFLTCFADEGSYTILHFPEKSSSIIGVSTNATSTAHFSLAVSDPLSSGTYFHLTKYNNVCGLIETIELDPEELITHTSSNPYMYTFTTEEEGVIPIKIESDMQANVWITVDLTQ